MPRGKARPMDPRPLSERKEPLCTQKPEIWGKGRSVPPDARSRFTAGEDPKEKEKVRGGSHPSQKLDPNPKMRRQGS